MRAALTIAVVLGACGGDDPVAPPDADVVEHCPIGDVTAAGEAKIVFLDANNLIVDPSAMGSAVPLQPPPQGGWILLVGIRARNVDACSMQLTTALVDSVDGQIIKIDQRQTDLAPAADGWGISTASSVGNLQVCPQLTATRDLHGQPYVISAVAEAVDGKKLSASITVVPTCPAGESRCTCECDRDYVVGNPCP